jgi:hypothetical protein
MSQILVTRRQRRLARLRGAPTQTDIVETPVMKAAEEHDYAPPDPYAGPIAAIRAAEATDLSRAEDAYKAARLDDLKYEPEVVAAEQAFNDFTPPTLRVLSDEQLAEFDPPDPYAAGIKALQAKEGR